MPPASANEEGNYRELCILLPASLEPQQTRPDDERSGNGTTPGGESDKVGSGSATSEMEWGEKKAGQLHRDYSVCDTVNLKDLYGSKAVDFEYVSVREEPIEDPDESTSPAPEEDFEDVSVKEELIEDPDESTSPAPEEGCEATLVKQQPAYATPQFPRLAAEQPFRDPLDIGESSVYIKQEHELKNHVDGLEQNAFRDLLDIGESSVHIKQEHELKKHVDGLEQNECQVKEEVEASTRAGATQCVW